MWCDIAVTVTIELIIDISFGPKRFLLYGTICYKNLYKSP